MTDRICPRCNGNGNIVVKIGRKTEVVICPRCDGAGTVPIENT